MTPFPWSDVAIIAVLILLNGLFALSELAIVSARGPRLQAAEKRGSRGAKIARKEGCDLIIAIGGGSTMDASKVMAAAFYYEGDPWDMIFHGQPNPHIPAKALPVITVPTLAATGSEMNCGAVITNEETKEKSFAQTECLYPRVAWSIPNSR